MKNKHALLVLLLLASCVGLQPPLAAQLIARQGAPSEDIDAQEQTRFVSPMILESPLEALDPGKLGQDVPVPGGLPKYYCENVKVLFLKFRAVSTAKKPLSLVFRVTMAAATGHDKSVTVRFQVIEHGVSIASHTIRNIKVEEGNSVLRDGAFEMPAEWTPSGNPPILRVTVSLRDI